jgi:hypothetical protein
MSSWQLKGTHRHLIAHRAERGVRSGFLGQDNAGAPAERAYPCPRAAVASLLAVPRQAWGEWAIALLAACDPAEAAPEARVLKGVKQCSEEVGIGVLIVAQRCAECAQFLTGSGIANELLHRVSRQLITQQSDAIPNVVHL